MKGAMARFQMKEISDPVVEKLLRSEIESAVDVLKYITMFSDEGEKMKSFSLA